MDEEVGVMRADGRLRCPCTEPEPVLEDGSPTTSHRAHRSACSARSGPQGHRDGDLPSYANYQQGGNFCSVPSDDQTWLVFGVLWSASGNVHNSLRLEVAIETPPWAGRRSSDLEVGEAVK